MVIPLSLDIDVLTVCVSNVRTYLAITDTQCILVENAVRVILGEDVSLRVELAE